MRPLATACAKSQAIECDTPAATHPEVQAGVSGGRSYPFQDTHYHQKRASAGGGVPHSAFMPDDAAATDETQDDAFMGDLDD